MSNETENAMSERAEVMVTIDGSKPVYVSPELGDRIRDEVASELKSALGAAYHGLRDIRTDDLDGLKETEFAIARASSAISALVNLAPIPDYEESA